MCNRNACLLWMILEWRCEGNNLKMWYFNVNLFSLCQNTVHISSNTLCPTFRFILYVLLFPTLSLLCYFIPPAYIGAKSWNSPWPVFSPLLMTMLEQGWLGELTSYELIIAMRATDCFLTCVKCCERAKAEVLTLLFPWELPSPSPIECFLSFSQINLLA